MGDENEANERSERARTRYIDRKEEKRGYREDEGKQEREAQSLSGSGCEEEKTRTVSHAVRLTRED